MQLHILPKYRRLGLLSACAYKSEWYKRAIYSTAQGRSLVVS